MTRNYRQLRDLIICPRERGVVNYVKEHSIVEHNVLVPDPAPPRTVVDLGFTPNTLASLRIPETDQSLFAAGGQEAELHLSLHVKENCIWGYKTRLNASINNSVLLTSLSLTQSNEGSVEPRVVVSNNDCTVKFFDVPLRPTQPKTILFVGSLRLDVPVNHCTSFSRSDFICFPIIIGQPQYPRMGEPFYLSAIHPRCICIV